MHVGSNGKRSKTGAVYCPARNDACGDGETSGPVLGCGGTVSFMESFVNLGSPLHYDLSDHLDVEARTKKAPRSFGAVRSKIWGSADIPERLKGKVYAGGVLAKGVPADDVGANFKQGTDNVWPVFQLRRLETSRCQPHVLEVDVRPARTAPPPEA